LAAGRYAGSLLLTNINRLRRKNHEPLEHHELLFEKRSFVRAVRVVRGKFFFIFFYHSINLLTLH
jgi:hypothetical protein